MPKVTVMIPALLGSTRIKDKNLYLVDGYPMMHYAINAAKKATKVDEIIVNSEHDIFKRIADMHEVNFFFRSKDKGGSACTMSNKSMDCKGNRCQVHDHFIYDFLCNVEMDYLVQIHTTSPLLKPDTIDGFIESLINNEYDSQFAVMDIFEESLYAEKPINFELNKKRMTQSLEPIKSLTWAISGWKAQSFKESYELDDVNENGPTFCGKVGYYNIPKTEGLDADTEEDLFIIEAVLAHQKKRGNFLKHKFNENIIEMDSDLERLIHRDGVANVDKLEENNSEMFTISVESIKENMSGDSWCYPLFYNMTDQICLIRQNKNEGCRNHYHVTKGEWWFVIEGTFKWIIDSKDEYIVNKGEVIYLPPGTIHKILCISDEPGIRMAGGGKEMEHIYVD